MFVSFDPIIGKYFEWDEPVWISSLDPRNAFDKIEFESCLPHIFIKISRPGMDILETVLDSSNLAWCQTRRRVEPDFVQGRFGTCFRSWKTELSTQGLHVGVPKRVKKREICG